MTDAAHGTRDAGRERSASALHSASLTLFKAADGIVEPKLVLAWLLGALGAPGAMIGALVPVREAGALLPQLAIAAWMGRGIRRKWVWAAGAALQGLAVLAIALAALTLEGAAAGAAILVALAVFAIARAACSVSQKDALARTVEKGARGRITGRAGSLAAASVLVFGAALATGLLPLEVWAISAALALAGALFLTAGALFTRLDEPMPEQAETNAQQGGFLAPLRESADLRAFVLARALLVPTALAPPFLVMASTSEGQSLGSLGPLVIAAALASIASAWIWGRLSDSSSRRCMMAGGTVSALTLALAAVVVWVTGGLGGVLGAASAMLLAQIGYEGVRVGRKTHLTDMAPDEVRAAWTALSNTLIGGALILGASLGLLADVGGPGLALSAAAALTAAGAMAAGRLTEVQRKG